MDGEEVIESAQINNACALLFVIDTRVVRTRGHQEFQRVVTYRVAFTRFGTTQRLEIFNSLNRSVAYHQFVSVKGILLRSE